MGKYLDIAKEGQAGRDVSDQSDLSTRTVHGLDLADIRAESGDDWPALQADPVLLDTFARAIQARRIRERGEVPAHYRATTHCQQCGPVPIFTGCPDKVLACPWCFNRVAGLPMPSLKDIEAQDGAP